MTKALDRLEYRIRLLAGEPTPERLGQERVEFMCDELDDLRRRLQTTNQLARATSLAVMTGGRSEMPEYGKLKIEIRVTGGGRELAGRLHTVSREGATCHQLLKGLDGGPLGVELDKAMDHVKRQLRDAREEGMVDVSEGGQE